VSRKPARAKDDERVVHATMLRRDLAKQLDKQAIADAPDVDVDEDADVIVVDGEGELLSGELAAAAACKRETKAAAEIDVVMVLDAELAERLEAAELELHEVLEEVLDEAERSER
jgi:hypothetical protein